MRTVIAEPEHYAKEAVDIYRSFGDVMMGRTLSRQELLDAVSDAEVLVIRLAHKIDRQVFNSAPNLKIIACPTTGLDHIDLIAAAENGVRVVSLKGEAEFLRTIHASAEHVMAMLLALLRRVPWAFDSIRRGEWNRDAFKGHELYKKTIGIIGFGRIGSLLAGMTRGFGMKVIVSDPNVIISGADVTRAPLDELLSSADVVALCIPYEARTERMMNAEAFARMKPRSIFVNISRGQVVDEAALIDALSSGKLAGAAVDVIWAEEKRPVVIAGDPLVEYAKTHQNLLITPHLGGATYESMTKTEIFIAEKVQSLVPSP